MFPFLSVLFCTIGALVVIMVIGSMRTAVKDVSVDVRLEDVTVQAAKLAGLQAYVTAMEQSISEISEAKTESAKLSDEASVKSNDLEEEKVGLADLEAKGREDLNFVEKADLALVKRKREAAYETTQTVWRASRDAVQKARDEETALNRQIEATKSEIDSLKEKAAQPIAHFRFEDDSEGRKPVLLELKADGVFVHSDGAPRPEGTTIPKDEARARNGFVDELAASLTRPGAKRYAALFVRPGAVDLYFATTERLRKKRAPYSAEPVEANWKLMFDTGETPPE